MLLGCIADDLTGATDLSLLAREGMPMVQTIGLPIANLDPTNVDALVSSRVPIN